MPRAVQRLNEVGDGRALLSLELVENLATVLYGVIDFTEGMRGDQRIGQQQQRRDEQREPSVPVCP